MGKQRGEVTITLCDVDLHLEYKTRNLMAFTEITGKSPLEYLERFEGLSPDNATEMAKQVCDLPFVISFVVAGLAGHKEYATTKQTLLRNKICKLIDSTASRRKVPVFQVVSEIAAEILPAILGSFVVEGEVEGNVEVPPTKGAESNESIGGS